MRKGWEYKKLGEVGQIVTGSTPSTKDESNYSPREYCFVKPSDLPSQGIADIEETEYFVSQVGLSKSRVLPAGSVLVSCIGSIGKIGILTKEACSNQQINAIIPQDETDSRFIAYSLYAQRFVLESIANAPVVPIINKTDFSKIRIGIPPKSTQLAIVSELDKINELIRLKKEQLKDFDNLAQSLFYEMFGDPVENEKGWEVKKLNNICDVRDGTHDSPKYLQNSEYILITSKNIVNGSIDFENVNYISEEDYIKINKRSKVDNGDIIMPMIGTIGNPIIAHIDGTHKFCIKNVALIKFLADSTVNNMFIVNLMRCSSFSSYLLNQNKGGTQKFVALGAIRKLPILLPPLSLQRLFAQRIEQIEREKSEVQKSIQDLETLLASRMQYWFE